MFAAVVAALTLQATEPLRTVVHSDARSGRLVRSLVAPKRSASSAGPVWEIAERIAETHQLESDLLHSLIKVESNYNPYAISPKGALGIMQLIPSTARRFGVVDVFNPVQNIDGGALYLKHLLELYNGDYDLALAAYNAGEAAVAKYGGIPPYRETQSYVRQVGNKLSEARRNARKPQPARVASQAMPVQTAEVYNPIHAILGPDGRVSYVTR